jgi:hypothetical protein
VLAVFENTFRVARWISREIFPYHFFRAKSFGMRSLSCLAGVVGLFAAVVNASLNPIVVKGNAFFDSVTGKRFYIRGVDYQVSPPILRNADLSPVDLLL